MPCQQKKCRHLTACGVTCVQVAIRNNQQGVLYFTSPFKPDILGAPAASPLDDNFFVSAFLLPNSFLCSCLH